MKHSCTILALAAAGLLVLGTVAVAQDQEPSLGDAARQARQQKQQKDAQSDKDSAGQKNPQPASTPAANSKEADKKPAQGSDSQPKVAAANGQTPKAGKRVITNDEIPEHIGPTSTLPAGSQQPTVPYQQPSYGNIPGAAEQWKNQILQMKNYIASMQSQIANMEQSVHYAGGNCVSGCVQWNERQRENRNRLKS